MDGSRFTDQSEGRAEGRNVLVIITREAAAAAAARDDLARRLVIAVGIDIRANTGDMHQNSKLKYRKVQLNFTPEMEVLYMLILKIERYLSNSI